MGFFFMMDSDSAATTLLTGKIHRCLCGRRMSSLIHDFHSICVDCDAHHRCPECTDVGDSVMSKYIAPKLSLQLKLQSKCSKKDPVPAPAVAAESDCRTFVVTDSASIPTVSLVPVDDSSLSDRGEILRQVKCNFYSKIHIANKPTCVSDSSPISKLPRQTTLNFTLSRVKFLQLPVTRLAAATLPAGSWVDTPYHPQFIVCRRCERLSLTRLLIISLFAPFSVLQCLP